MSLEGSVAELAVVTSQSATLANLVDEDGVFHIVVSLNAPGTSIVVAEYNLKGAKLDSQEFSSGIGDNKSVTFNFSTQIGGPNDTVSGFYLRGEPDSYAL